MLASLRPLRTAVRIFSCLPKNYAKPERSIRLIHELVSFWSGRILLVKPSAFQRPPPVYLPTFKACYSASSFAIWRVGEKNGWGLGECLHRPFGGGSVHRSQEFIQTRQIGNRLGGPLLFHQRGTGCGWSESRLSAHGCV